LIIKLVITTILLMSISNWKFNKTNNETFFWQALSESEEILGRSSQDFKSQNGAKYNADLLGRNGKYSKQLIWNFTQNSQKDWKWTAHNSINKEEIAASHKAFDTQADAVKNAVLFGYSGEFAPLSTSGAMNSATKIGAGVATASAFAATSVSSIKANSEAINPGTNHTDIDTKSTHTNQNFSTAPNSAYTPTIEYKDGIFSMYPWLKWLLIGLLLLALIFWLLPLLINKFKGTSTDTKSNTSISVDKPAGLIGALPATNFNLLSTNIQAAGLLDTVNKAGNLTLLAPVNSAFESLSTETLANLKKPENLTQYQSILKNHLFAGNIDLNSLKDGSTIKSLAGYDLPVKIEGTKLFIDGVEVDKTIDGTNNGINVYSVPKLLDIPATPVVQAASVANPPAPTVPVTPLPTPAVVAPVVTYKTGGSLDIANKAGSFKTLLAAVNAAELKDALEADGPITIFAPTDEVFAKIKPTVDDLLKPENKIKLQAFLKNHVAVGRFTFVDFQAGKVVTTLSGQIITLNTGAHAGNGQVVGPKSTSLAPVADIITSNGVVHTLTDSVIL
jgi:transforming growth factor-beta-induced protein